MHRYKIVIQYDGSFFKGWQLQKNQKTVQGEIENALMTISGSKSRIIVKGSGRTDAGVHAIGQVAHFDLDTHLNETQLKNALNFYNQTCASGAALARPCLWQNDLYVMELHTVRIFWQDRSGYLLLRIVWRPPEAMAC